MICNNGLGTQFWDDNIVIVLLSIHQALRHTPLPKYPFLKLRFLRHAIEE
jgi:hypothetical protein